MNHLVFLDTEAGELEKILSGMKTMLIKEIDQPQIIAYPVSPGDSLYFLRDNGECELRVKAAVVRVLSYENSLDEELPQILKEMQPRLQLTEGQYNHWCTQNQVWLVEFESAHKIGVIQVALDKILDRSGWVAFKEFSLITHKEVLHEHNRS
jgi:hypothetical protein